MFTGLISDVGRVVTASGEVPLRLRVTTGYDTGKVERGASVACAGVCLTVVDKGTDWLEFDVSEATRSLTTLGDWAAGTPVNMERALRVGDELGGHIVTGHVDGVGEITALEEVSGSKRLGVKFPEALAPYITVKGSVAVDGVSLTVNAVNGTAFEANLVPHTVAKTAFREAKVGDRVNLEVDIIARYLSRLAGQSAETAR